MRKKKNAKQKVPSRTQNALTVYEGCTHQVLRRWQISSRVSNLWLALLCGLQHSERVCERKVFTRSENEPVQRLMSLHPVCLRPCPPTPVGQKLAQKSNDTW